MSKIQTQKSSLPHRKRLPRKPEFPLSLHQQVITLWTATHKKLVHVDKKHLKKYQMDMLEYFDNIYPEIGKEIDEKKVLSDELGEKILQAADEFKDRAAAK